MSEGEEFPSDVSEKARLAIGSADLMIIMGTNVTHQAAQSLPLNERLVMIDVETSSMEVEEKASLIINEKADKVMELLLQKLSF